MKRLWITVATLLISATAHAFQITNTANVTLGANQGHDFRDFRWKIGGYGDEAFKLSFNQSVVGVLPTFKMWQNTSTGRVTHVAMATNEMTVATTNITWEIARTNMPYPGEYYAEVWGYSTGDSLGNSMARGKITVSVSGFDSSQDSYSFPHATTDIYAYVASILAGSGGGSSTGAVDSVFGRTGAVVADSTDYAAYYATLAQGVSGTNAQARVAAVEIEVDVISTNTATKAQGALAESALQDYSTMTGADVAAAGGLTNAAAFDPVGSAAAVSNALAAGAAAGATALQPSATNGWEVGSHADLYPRNNPSNYITAADVPAETDPLSLHLDGGGIVNGTLIVVPSVANTNAVTVSGAGTTSVNGIYELTSYGESITYTKTGGGILIVYAFGETLFAEIMSGPGGTNYYSAYPSSLDQNPAQFDWGVTGSGVAPAPFTSYGTNQVTISDGTVISISYNGSGQPLTGLENNAGLTGTVAKAAAAVTTNDVAYLASVTEIINGGTSGTTGAVARTGRSVTITFPEPGEGGGITASTATNIAETVVAAATTNDMPGIDWGSLGGGGSGDLTEVQVSGGLLTVTSGTGPVPMVGLTTAAVVVVRDDSYQLPYILASASTVTVTRAMGDTIALTQTGSILKFTISNATFPTNGVGAFTLDLRKGANTIAFDTTLITNSTLLDISATQPTTLRFRKPFNSTLWRVRQ